MKSDKPNIDLRRYAIAVGAVALGTLLLYEMNVWVGPLPTYITFYPAVMLAALHGGFWPGIVATVLVDVVTDYWLLPPVGFGIARFPDAVGLWLFSLMGVFMSTVAEFYLRARVKAVAYDKKVALREISCDKEFLASILERASQPFGVGYPDGRLGLINNAFEKLTGYTKDELKSIDWDRVLTPPEWRDIEQEQLEYLNRIGQPIRYEKEYIRKDGTRVPIELLVHRITDSEGKPECYYSFIT
jgi:PAS domain S-box-containing protein